ncbi:MAG: hypothetical protein IKQ09_07870 [Bacteroidales bacterium]|nr:hypothetical protein [Bacteroidales bacterium]MBR6092712.1 hypothetical protein [Bacteroidales bacterium]
MLADYMNNPLMPMSYSGVSEKWYEVARTLERSLFEKLDVFMYLSVTQDNTFDLVYVAIDEISRKLTRCYHGKFVFRMRKNYLIIRKGLWRKRYLVIDYDETAGIVALSNKRKSKCWILSKKLPYDKTAYDKIIISAEKQGVDMKNLKNYY